MRQAEKARKKFYSRISFILDPGKKIPKKIKKKKNKKLKNHFPAFFQSKRDEIGRKGEKKILVQKSVQTQPGQENSEKNCKKIEKFKKPLSVINFSQNGMRQDGQEKKKIQFRIPFILYSGKKIAKKWKKNWKN